MPMDIRSFFAKKPDAAGKKAAAAVGGGGGGGGGAAKKDKTTASAAAAAAPSSNNRAKKSKVDNDVKPAAAAAAASKIGKTTATTSNKRIATPAASKPPPAVSKKDRARLRKKDDDDEDTKSLKGFSSSSSSSDEAFPNPSPQKKIKTTTATATATATARSSSSGGVAKTMPSKSQSISPGSAKKRTIRDLEDDDDDDDDDDDFVMVVERPSRRSSPARAAKKSTVQTPSPAATTPTTKKTTTPSSTSSAKRANSNFNKTPETKKAPILQPTLDRDSFDVDTEAVVSECLAGLTFVCTGILEHMPRDDVTDLIKTLGGRVTTGVSGKTSFLVVGQVLEDGRQVEEGKKYQAALEKKIPLVVGESKLFGLCHLYQNWKKKEAGIPEHEKVVTTTKPAASAFPTTTSSAGKPVVPAAPTTASAAPPNVQAAAAPPTKVNPYAKKPAVNPYAKKPGTASGDSGAGAANPYAKKNPYSKGSPGGATLAAAAAGTGAMVAPSNHQSTSLNQLWVDRHAPTSTRDILGNKDNVQKLATWLNNWERTFNNPKSYNKAFSNPKGPWKAALLSGPPGIGKTTTATLVAKEAGRDLREFNASDARSKKALQEQLGDLTGSQSLGFQVAGAKPRPSSSKKTLRCIIMDEVDGMGAGDRSGMAELIQMIKKSKVPIICICNDRQSQKMKSLLPYCMDLRFKRPTKNIMANRAVRIAEMEGLSVERNAAEAIAESCGNDVRQVLNVLQMWAQKKGGKSGEDESLTYKSLKERESSINKDEILRVSLFDAARTIMEGRKGLSGADAKTQTDSLFRRSDAFFVDYSFTGLLVQQNYPRVMQSQYGLVKKADNPTAELKFLNRMHDAAASMSDYAVIENAIRTGDQNWSLLPASSMMTVKTGFHAGGKTGGNLPGYPEFTAWMGKNSSRNKKQRILSELHHHMNFKISADSQQLRESYLPVFRERFLSYFQGSDRSEEANDSVIQLMDEYGLSREDVMEKLDEFSLAINKGEGSTFADLDSKQKAAFTRRYNQGSHKSQALVQEEFGTTKLKRGGGGKRERDPHDMDAIDDDGDDVEEESEGEDEEAELRKLQEKLKKKGRKPAASKAKPAAKKGKKTK